MQMLHLETSKFYHEITVQEHQYTSVNHGHHQNVSHCYIHLQILKEAFNFIQLQRICKTLHFYSVFLVSLLHKNNFFSVRYRFSSVTFQAVVFAPFNNGANTTAYNGEILLMIALVVSREHVILTSQPRSPSNSVTHQSKLSGRYINYLFNGLVV